MSISQCAVTPLRYYCSGKINTTFRVRLTQFGEYVQFRFNASLRPFLRPSANIILPE